MGTATTGADVEAVSSSCWRVGFTGCFTILADDGRTVTPRGRRARAILAYLCADAGRKIPRERLIELLWGNRGETQARDSFRQALMEIRRSIGDLVGSDRDHVWVCAERLVIDESAPGEPLEELDAITPEFDAWLIEERKRRASHEWDRLRDEAARLLAQGDAPAALPLIERMRQINPYQEEWARLAMRAEFQAASPARICMRFQELSEILQRDLGVAPASETRGLRDQLIAELTNGSAAPLKPMVERSEPASQTARAAAPRRGVSRRLLIGAGLASGTAIAGGALVYRALAPPRAQSLHTPLIVAVLPFTVESDSAELVDFARQLSDQVRSDLSRVTDIRVIAGSSSRSAVAEAGSTAQIGKLLGASLLIEGQVDHRDGRIISTVAFIDPAQAVQTWSDRETVSASAPGDLRVAVGGAIVQQLAGMITLSSAAPVAVQRPDPQAYALVLEANQLMEQIRTESMRGRREEALALGSRAEGLANRALSIDPQDSGALAVLATIVRNGWTPALAHEPLTTEQRVEASISIVRRALLADARNPAALTELGDYYRRFCFRWNDAENLFRRALAINPSLVEAHWSYGYQLGTLGRGIEGLDHALSVYELDPRNPFHRVALPRLLYLVGQRGAAMERYSAELREQPDNLFLLEELYFLFLSEGSAPDLERLYARLAQLRPQAATRSAMSKLMERIKAGAQALKGEPQRLRALVDADVQEFDQPLSAKNATPQGRARDDLPYIFAIEYSSAGAFDQAIDMLDRALAAKSLYWPPTLPFGIAQFPRAMRESERFAALWDRDPGLVELVHRRRTAILAGQMAGFTPDGRKVIPTLPRVLADRARAALARG